MKGYATNLTDEDRKILRDSLGPIPTPERIMALEHLAEVVRANVGRRAKRSAYPAPMTVCLDRIRDALAYVDAADGRWRDGTYGATP